MFMQKIFLPFLLVFCCNLFVAAQPEAYIESNYDPHALFSPLFYPNGETITRAATGEPNTGYWQKLR